MISNQTIADLMTTALEGGSNYWIDKIDPPYANHEEYSEPKAYAPGMISRFISADDEPDRLYVLNQTTIQAGAKVMASKYPDHWADVVNDNMDADTADVFLQCVLFQEIIYG